MKVLVLNCGSSSLKFQLIDMEKHERMAKGLNLMTNLAGGVFQIAAGGAGLVSGTAQIGSTLTNLNEHRNGAYIPAGNGRNTFANIVKENSYS